MLKPTDNFDPTTASASARRRATAQSRVSASEKNHHSGFQPLTPPSTPKVKQLSASQKAVTVHGRVSEQEKSVIRGEIQAQSSEPLVSGALASSSGPSEGPAELKNKAVSEEKFQNYKSNLEQQKIQQQKQAECENKDCGCFVVCPSHPVPVDCTCECPPSIANTIHVIGKCGQDVAYECAKTLTVNFGINFGIKKGTELGLLDPGVAEVMGMSVNPPQQQQMSREKNVETAQAPVLSQNPGGQTRSPTEMRSTSSFPYPPMASMSASILPMQNTKQSVSSQLEPQYTAFTAESQMGNSTTSSNQNQPSVAVATPPAIPPNGKNSFSFLVQSWVIIFLMTTILNKLPKFLWNLVFGRLCFQQVNSQNKIPSLKNQQNSSLDVRELLIQNTSETKQLRKEVELLLSAMVELCEKVEKVEKVEQSLNQEDSQT